MYQAKRSLDSEYFLQWELKMLGFALLLNASACHCNQKTMSMPPLSTLDMEISTVLLIGNATKIETIFRIGGFENEVNMGSAHEKECKVR